MKSVLFFIMLLLTAGMTLAQVVADSTGAITVTGEVKELSTGKPLAGMNVFYQQYAAVLTDDNGHFSLLVPDDEVSISITGPGYQQKEVPLKGRQTILVYLAVSQQPDHWKVNSETPDSWLQGNVAGLQVTRRSGTPGIGASLQLRGFTSLYATNQPLIVVDGMIYDNNSYGTSLTGGHLNNPLQDIDVKDIDHITVIKDGLTTYGTKGANGVVLINTSRARELATRIDFAAYSGVNLAPSGLPVMRAGDYRTYLSDLLKTSGYTDTQIQALPYMQDDPAGSQYYKYHNNTDWQKQVLKQSYNQHYYLKITGGDDIARYALSMGYGKNRGVTDNTGLTRYTTRFNADLNLTKRLTANADIGFTYNEQQLKDQGLSPKTNPIYLAQIKSPFVAVHELNSAGVASPNYADTDTFNVSNPLALIHNASATDKNYRFNGLVNFNYRINHHFNIGALVGITYDKIRENIFIPRKGVANDTLDNAIADSRLGSRVQRFFSVYNDTHLSYDQVFNNIHQLHVSVGFRYNQSNSEEDKALGYNSATDDLISVGTGMNALRKVSGEIGEWRWLNNYASVDYNLRGKYFLQAGVAVDGSSRFGKATKEGISIGTTKYAVMPSVGLAWLVSAERFMSAVSLVESLRLHASYGITGNDDIGNYAARRYYVSQNLLGMQGLVRGNVANPALQWEKVEKLNAGLNATWFNERLSFNLDVYRHNTSRMLTYENTISAAGIDAIITNHGSMYTKGMDVSLQGRILDKQLKWEVGINAGSYRNKVTALPGNPVITSYAGATYITQPGSAANLFYGYKTQGIYRTNAAAQKEGYTVNGLPATGGDVRFTDIDNNHIIDEHDRQVIGNPAPDLFGGISNRLSFKRWTLDVLFTFSLGNDVYNYTRQQLESGSTTNNQTLALVNRWRADGQITDIPAVAMGDPKGNARFSDRWIEDGSYLRLRTLSVSYDIPVNARFLKYAKVYATGNNLLTFTKYLGYDPEFSAGNSIFTQGVDTGLEPLFRSVQLGVRVGL